MDWGQLFLQPEWLERIDKLAERRFGRGGLAEEAAGFVVDLISANDWARCRGFQGKSRPETFLYTLIGNAMEEFSRKRFGRVRPPEWLKREGPLWVEVWTRLCMERQMEHAVSDTLLASGDREPEFVAQVVRTIKARLPWCGQSAQEIPLRYFDSDDGSERSELDKLSVSGDVGEDDEKRHYEMLLLALGYLISSPMDSSQRDALEDQADSIRVHYRARFERFAAALVLSDEERLILRMVYQDGLKKNAIAGQLGIPAHQPGRILKRVFERIEIALDEADLDINLVRSTLLDD